MKDSTSPRPTTFQNGKHEKSDSTKTALKSSQLMKLFESELKDIYGAENALLKAIPKMIKNATSPRLIESLTSHLAETENQIDRIEEIFDLLDKKPVAKKCEAMSGLIKEAAEFIDSCEQGAMRDAAIILAAQKIEHYEIATYGGLCTFAKMLGKLEIAQLMQGILDEEKAADSVLANWVYTLQNEAAEKPISEV
jgi:ferritin-like metal-binding protein YciE